MTLSQRLLIALCLLTLPFTAAATLHDQVAEQLRDRLEVATAAGEHRDADPERSPLHRFFVDRVYRPAWSEHGQPSARADELLAVLAESRSHGLSPAAYGYEELRGQLQDWPEAPSPGAVADLELQLTRVWLQLAEDALTGQLNPDIVAPDWELQPPPSEDLVQALREGLEEKDVGEAIRRLYPDQENYHQMRQALAHLRALAERGEYPRMPRGPLLRVGDRDPRVETLRNQLWLLGDLDEEAPGSDTLYDSALEAVVRDFQHRHGLQVDGVVGPRTLAALNTPPAERAEQLRVNLERVRWMPRALGERYILVNIAGFSMTVHEAGETVMQQRVVVGRDYRRTPVFTGNMTYLVLNPSWEVPHRLATRDVLPLIQRDPDYLERMGFRVLQGWGAEEQKIDPETLDWDRYSHRFFPYRLRQLPGPQNAMGRVKFMFPNRHNVYLHDTPSRELFQQPRRAFSSGCIRVERPLALTAWLLRDQPQWSPEDIDQALESRRERTVPLRRGVPVHLQYWTAWTEADGTLHFRDDLYNRDSGVAATLAALPKPGPTLWPELSAIGR